MFTGEEDPAPLVRPAKPSSLHKDLARMGQAAADHLKRTGCASRILRLPIIVPTGGYVTCYTTSLYLIVFKCVSRSGEAQLSIAGWIDS